MGQKVNPIGLRVGITRTWESRWFSEKNYAQWLKEDLELRKFVREFLLKSSAGRAAAEGPGAAGAGAAGRGRRQTSDPGIARIEIERAPGKIKFIVHTSRPGQVIGKAGAGIEDLKKELVRRTKKEIYVDVREVRKPDADAQLVAESIAQQIERRLPFRRAMKRAITMALKSGAEGVRVRLAGRLGGAEMSRIEAYREGRVPLHTLRADIDFGYTIARTTYGAIGCKVWIYRGEVLADEKTGAKKRIAI